MTTMSEEERLAAEWASLASDEPEATPKATPKPAAGRPITQLERIGAALLLVVLEHRDDKGPTLRLIADVYHALGETVAVSGRAVSRDGSEPPMEEIMASIRRIISEEP